MIDDLRSIRSYIAEHDPAAASRVAVKLVAACDQLETLSHRGRRGLVAGTHELASVRSYVIVYRVTPGTVQIMRVWHGVQHRPV